MPKLCSFREFLATGKLDELTPEKNLMEVADLLGTPQYWMDGGHNGPYPLYWGYTGKHRDNAPCIEIAFNDIPPHAMSWFQFEHADCFSDEVHVFGNDIVLAMDGFTSETRASELISSGGWDPRLVRVYYNAKIDMLLVTSGQVEVTYMLEDDESDKLDEARRTELQEAFGRAALFAEMDAKYLWNSIFSHPAQSREQLLERPGMSMCTGEQYLRSLRA